jgi:hypothetical protein
LATELQKKWEEKIRRAEKAKKDWADQFEVPKLRQYFEGKQNPGYPADEWITINKFYSHVMAQLPLLYSMDPYFYVKLKKSYSIDPEGDRRLRAEREGSAGDAELSQRRPRHEVSCSVGDL